VLPQGLQRLLEHGEAEIQDEGTAPTAGFCVRKGKRDELGKVLDDAPTSDVGLGGPLKCS